MTGTSPIIMSTLLNLVILSVVLIAHYQFKNKIRKWVCEIKACQRRQGTMIYEINEKVDKGDEREEHSA